MENDAGRTVTVPDSRGAALVVKWWDIPAIPLTALVGGLVIPFVLAFAGATLAVHLGYTAEAIQKYVASQSFVFLAAQGSVISLYASGLGAIYFLARRRGYRLLPTSFGRSTFGKSTLPLLLAASASGVVLVVLAAVVVRTLPPSIQAELRLPDFISGAKTARQAALQFFIMVTVVPPIEELYFRGLLLSWLKSKLNMTAAAIVSACVFSAMHGYFLILPGWGGWIWTGQMVALGLLTAYWVNRHGSLWPAIATHASYNLLASASLWSTS